MGKSKKGKYTLFSSDTDGPKVCAFFNSKEGCKNGANCKFLHGDPPSKCKVVDPAKSQQVSDASSDISSDISSESSRGDDVNNQAKMLYEKKLQEMEREKQLLEEKMKNMLKKQNQQNDNSAQKQTPKNKKKNKKRKNEQSPFASSKPEVEKKVKLTNKPVNESSNNDSLFVTESPFGKNESNKKEQGNLASPVPRSSTPGSFKSMAEKYSLDTMQTDQNFGAFDEEKDDALQYLEEIKRSVQKRNESSPPQAAPSTPNFSGFRGMNLPVAPYSGSSSKPNSDSITAMRNDNGISCPLPDKAPGSNFVKAIIKTRSHPRYAGDYDFSKHKNKENSSCSWFQPRQYGSWCANNPQVIAIDCEMCETKNPHTGETDGKALCRISITNGTDPTDVLLDTLVKPDWPVTDYRSRINGISESDLQVVQFTLSHAQAFMKALCSDKTVIVGHGLINDLVSLKMEHYCNVDTSYLFTVKDDLTENKSSTASLKDCVSFLLNEKMPDVHDSVNDAVKSLNLCQHFLRQDAQVVEVVRPVKKQGNSLFIHRLPNNGKITKAALSNLFLNNTHVKPSEVEDIEFSGKSGKTYAIFASVEHANLAFDSLKGPAAPEKSGRLQKKVFMRNGEYIQVRKMGKQ